MERSSRGDPKRTAATSLRLRSILIWIMTTGQSATHPQHVAVLQVDDIYQNVEERFEMAN